MVRAPPRRPLACPPSAEQSHRSFPSLVNAPCFLTSRLPYPPAPIRSETLSGTLLEHYLRLFLSTFNFHLSTFNPSSPLSPLFATLMDLPASVANKRLTVWLNPLDPTLTKNTGKGSRLWLTTRAMY